MPSPTLYDPATEHDACGVGFVAHLRGQRSRSIVDDALRVLERLAHRGAAGCDVETGDGAGILLQTPHGFFQREAERLGIPLPARKQQMAVGMVFLPPAQGAATACEAVLEEALTEEGQRVLGWRDVPVAPQHAGRVARASVPRVRQIFVQRTRIPPSAFDRRLFVARKHAERRVAERGLDPSGRFHVASLSSETLVYKGLLLPRQLPLFYPDLADSALESGIALVHSRFSTNTLPTWDLAQPFRVVAHNGEINTVRGNRNWMVARRNLLHSSRLGGKLDRLSPIIVPGKSDSAQFDNMLELLVMAGRSVPHALMLMIPEAWEGSPEMDDDRRAFYEYGGSLVEPWDGPAAIAFSDGHVVGATLDRNGLRPARWLVTEDDRVALASEAGVLDVPAKDVKKKGRLRPGRMFVVDTLEGRILEDEEVKREVVTRFPYRKWLRRNVFSFASLPEPGSGGSARPHLSGSQLAEQQRAFGYVDEDLSVVLGPMGESGKEPTGSMGTDTPLAVLSDRAPSLFSYFHQLFAQVTNPPIDPIREALVMTLDTSIGPDGNPLEETDDQCHRIALPGVVLRSEELAKIAAMEDEGVFDPVVLPCLFEVAAGAGALERAVGELCDAASRSVAEGKTLLILSDRGVTAERAPIPALLALSAVHQRLVRDGIRRHTGLVVETGEAREVHHVALLVGFGAAAVCPWLAIDTVRALARDASRPELEAETNLALAIHDGLRKVMSKMGISTIQSYRGAQIFEAVGLDRALVEEHFTGVPSRLGGVGLSVLEAEARTRHAGGFEGEATCGTLPSGGLYRWRRRGEAHKWGPDNIAALQHAVRTGDAGAYHRYEAISDDEDAGLVTLRGLLALASDPFERGGRPDSLRPVPISEVEPASEIARRMVSGAMSFGSISPEAHETLAIAMNRLGARSNSGEGGEEPRRFVPDDSGDSRRSAIKQVASGRFGVTTEYLVNADELQIKIAQGAKPGEGGQLPGEKVDERIARVRCSTPGVMLISPPPHHDIYSIEDLSQLVYDLQSVSPRARISVKLVSEVGVGTIASGVAKTGAGGITISGFEGGTGASPLSSIKRAGLPWELGLAETQQVLVQNDLRGRVSLQVDGGLRTGRDVVVAALLGADEFGLATASLIAMGCVMLRKCHLNTCSVGVATQDPRLRERFVGEPEHVVRLFLWVAESARRHLARLGLRSMDEAVGRVELLRRRTDLRGKAACLDLAPLLASPNAPPEASRRPTVIQKKDVSEHFDWALLELAKPALAGKSRVRVALPVSNVDRAVGAMLSGEIARRHGGGGLPPGSVEVELEGSAGQSFGAFLAKGVTLTLEGEANDYVGKGLSGGRIVVRPPRSARYAAEDNVILGNVALYGATSGELFASGLGGERFAVRNAGARAVIEGLGDHGCEYMTGGVVVVLGRVGRNFAAGMSGGVAFVFDQDGSLSARVNRGMVDLESTSEEPDVWLLREMIETHATLTGSRVAERLLHHFEHVLPRFAKVMPRDYRRVLAARAEARRARPSYGAGPRLPLAEELALGAGGE